MRQFSHLRQVGDRFPKSMKNTRLKKAKPSSLKARSRTPRSPAKSASSSTAPTEQQIDKTLEKAELVAGGEVSRQTVLIREKDKPMIPPMPKRQYIPQPTDTPEVCAKQPSRVRAEVHAEREAAVRL